MLSVVKNDEMQTAPDTRMIYDVLHISAAARECGCCSETLRNWVKRGELPDRRDSGGRRIFTRDDVQKVKRRFPGPLAERIGR